MGIRSRNKVSVSFSMSSMTDIVFLLLIFFIILSTLVSPYGENIKLPSKKNTAVNQDKNPFELSITSIGNYQLNQRNISEAALIDQLEARKDDPNKPKLTLKVSPQVPAGETVKFFALAKKNDFEVVLVAQTR